MSTLISCFAWGISDQNRKNKVERFCNSFAAFFFLMPRVEFLRAAKAVNSKGKPWTDFYVARLANIFEVSKNSVAIHLEEMDLAPDGFYNQMKAIWRLRKPKEPGGRATEAEKIANRLGSRFVDVVFGAVNRGVITNLDAYDLTRVKPKHFDEVKREITQRRAAYGRTG